MNSETFEFYVIGHLNKATNPHCNLSREGAVQELCTHLDSLAILRAEIARQAAELVQLQERAELLQTVCGSKSTCIRELGIKLAAKDDALRGLMHADRCYCDAAFAGPGQHPRHTDECEAARAALSDSAPGWLSPEEAEALRAKAAEQGKNACELFDHLKESQKEAAKLREERDAFKFAYDAAKDFGMTFGCRGGLPVSKSDGVLIGSPLYNLHAELATAREDSARLDWLTRVKGRITWVAPAWFGGTARTAIDAARNEGGAHV